MTGFIELIVSFYTNIFVLLKSVVINLAGYNVSWGALIFAMIGIYMVVSIYWRGAKG